MGQGHAAMFRMCPNTQNEIAAVGNVCLDMTTAWRDFILLRVSKP